MIPVKKNQKAKCPHCGGRGFFLQKNENVKDTALNKTDGEELRIPNLTGTKEQRDEAMYIRARFIQIAKKHYQTEFFETFIKLISYESHSLFWIGSKECKIAALIAKIVGKNPTALDLIDRMK
jgi:hypothetical protein